MLNNLFSNSNVLENNNLIWNQTIKITSGYRIN